MQIIQNEKNLLRKNLIQKRIEIPAHDKLIMDMKIFNSLINLEQIKKAETILTYASTSIEVDTFMLINWAISIGKTVALPVTFKEHIAFYRINNISELKSGVFGILEPDVDEKNHIIDYRSSACIVPALAFDDDGFRIGYGKGYYDKFLSNYYGVKIGICYKDFIMKIPKENHDTNVEIIVTD